MSNAVRSLALVGTLLAATPFGLWLTDPRRVLSYPEYDPTGILGLVYIVLGSPRQGLEASNAVLWFYAIFVAVGVGALLLALTLLVRAWHTSAVPLLVTFLTCETLYFGTYLIGVPHGFPPGLEGWLAGPGAWIDLGLLPLALGVGLASLVHFSARFPRRLTSTDVAEFNRVRASSPRVVERAHSTIGRAAAGVGLGSLFKPDSPENRADRTRANFENWVLGPWLWIGFVMAALLFQLVERLSSIGSAGAMLLFPLCLAALFLPHAMFAVQGHRASQEDRRRVRWVAGGFKAALLLWVLAGVAAFGLTWVYEEVGWQLYMAALFAFGPLLMAAALVWSLGAAVLLGGVIDPDLAIKRTTVYAALVIVFAFLFAALEEWFGDILVGRFGISDGTASIVLGAAVALAVTPLRGVVDRLVSRGLATAEETAPYGPDSI